jgi:hypothetical protein
LDQVVTGCKAWVEFCDVDPETSKPVGTPVRLLCVESSDDHSGRHEFVRRALSYSDLVPGTARERAERVTWGRA